MNQVNSDNIWDDPFLNPASEVDEDRESIGGPFHENQVSFLIGFLRGVISMVGGVGGGP